MYLAERTGKFPKMRGTGSLPTPGWISWLHLWAHSKELEDILAPCYEYLGFVNLLWYCWVGIHPGVLAKHKGTQCQGNIAEWRMLLTQNWLRHLPHQILTCLSCWDWKPIKPIKNATPRTGLLETWSRHNKELQDQPGTLPKIPTQLPNRQLAMPILSRESRRALQRAGRSVWDGINL